FLTIHIAGRRRKAEGGRRKAEGGIYCRIAPFDRGAAYGRREQQKFVSLFCLLPSAFILHIEALPTDGENNRSLCRYSAFCLHPSYRGAAYGRREQ
ncbi:MAG: hypothetical protein ACK4HV_06270, partial [Parachlamydiaceae bacterium]